MVMWFLVAGQGATEQARNSHGTHGLSHRSKECHSSPSRAQASWRDNGAEVSVDCVNIVVVLCDTESVILACSLCVDKC